MVKILLLLLGLAGAMGATGYAVGTYLSPPAADDDTILSTATNETLYKLPLGRFTVQVIKPSRFFNIRFNMDVYIAGSANFERMNGGLSRSRMREDAMRHLSNMVETTLWVEETDQAELDPDALALTLARKLYHSYPMVRSARITDMATSRVDR